MYLFFNLLSRYTMKVVIGIINKQQNVKKVFKMLLYLRLIKKLSNAILRVIEDILTIFDFICRRKPYIFREMVGFRHAFDKRIRGIYSFGFNTKHCKKMSLSNY